MVPMTLLLEQRVQVVGEVQHWLLLIAVERQMAELGQKECG